MSSLRSIGILLAVIGIGSFILPLFGLQFKLILLPSALLGLPDFASGIIFITAGTVLFLLGRGQKQTKIEPPKSKQAR